MKSILFLIFFFVLNIAFSQRIYLKTNVPFFDAKDETTNYSNNGQGYIELSAVSYGLSRDEALTSGLNSSRSHPESITLSLELKNSYISLFKEMLKSTKGTTTLEIHFVRFSGNSGLDLAPYQILKLDNFLIQSIEPDGIKKMNVIMLYEKIHTKNYQIDERGSLVNPTSAGWDFTLAKEWDGI